MSYLLGTDEAGYGPNLGPLVVSATLWRIPDGSADTDLYARLGGTIQACPTDLDDCTRLAIADSKLLYKPGAGVPQMERGVMTALALVGTCPDRWSKLWAALDPDSADDRHALPWYADYDVGLPIDDSDVRIRQTSRNIGSVFSHASVALCRMRSSALFPARFNCLVERYGSKGAVLSCTTLELVRAMIEDLGDEAIYVVCDKHGGRNKYASLLQTTFQNGLVQVCREGREASIYRMGRPNRPVEFHFRAKGERFLPSALASMVSKYLRELSMRAFNDFWQRHVPQLRPTAGYPVDARRFKNDIETAQRELNIDDRVVWRSR